MIVRADYLTLCYLSQDGRESRTSFYQCVDIGNLVALVVEVKNHDICFPAVNTGMPAQVFVDHLTCFLPSTLPACGPTRVVPIFRGFVVSSVVGLLASLAHGAVTISSLPADREVIEQLTLSTRIAAFHIKSLPD